MVTIQDVLAILSELFQGLQQIPMKNIRPNPDNPGPPPTDKQIQDMADNIDKVGVKEPINVRANPANPLAEGVTLHPDNPRLRGDGRPWTLGDFNWLPLTGQLRYLACDRLKRETIPGFVLNPTEEEAVIINQLGNAVRDKGWWASYQNVENIIKANPNLTQKEVAVKLKLSEKKVNRAIRIIPLLNKETRTLLTGMAVHLTDSEDSITDQGRNSTGAGGSITDQGRNSSTEKGWISDKAVFQLCALGPGTGLKPGVRKCTVNETFSGFA